MGVHEIEDAKLIFDFGYNGADSHPIVQRRIIRAKQKGATLITCDPRVIEAARISDLHVQLKGGSNLALVNALCNVIYTEGLMDENFIAEHTEGFDEFVEVIKKYTPEVAEPICHVPAETIRKCARMYAKAESAMILYGMGVCQFGQAVDVVKGLANMALMTGNFGKWATGIGPVRGQNNVQGACDMGASPNQFPGYQNIDKEGILDKFEKAWNTKLNPKIGTKATDCFPKMLTGEVKGLFIFGEDPVRTDPNTHHVIKCLKALDFFVIDELFMTETAKLADVILPGISYTEKEGTFTNTERRVQRVRKAVTIEGEAKEDTWIFTEIMNRMGYPQPHLTAAEIMDEISSVTPSFAGISHARLDSEEVAGRGLQWPCTSKEHPGTQIMHVGKFSRGLGYFRPAQYEGAMEAPDEEYPLTMMTGRILYHYNACAMTDKTEGINEIANANFIEINTVDAEKLGVENGELVEVSSRRGTITATAHVSYKTNTGEVWMPFHYVDGANWLTNDALDSISSTPEYKACAVKVSKITA